MQWSEYIEQKNGILNGKPVIMGTRIGVEFILEKIGNGETIEESLTAYPHLSRAAILACISYGASSVRNEILLDVA